MRRHNFSAGPGALPDAVLAEAAAAVEEFAGSGVSILGLSHRSTAFGEILAEAEANVRELLALPPEYDVLFLQGGATLQFSMVATHLAGRRAAPPDYVCAGYWSERSIAETSAVVRPRVVWNGRSQGFRRLPTADELPFAEEAPYLHYVSNETVEGLQFHELLGPDGVPRVCDMSSDFLSRPFPIERFALVYAHAQKNLGPAGVTVVVLHRSVSERGPRDIPELLQYRSHVANRSVFHTPPVFAIYVTMLVTRWLLRDVGGLAAMERVNRRKAATLYDALDTRPDVFRCHAEASARSLMNVTFTLADRALEARLVEEAEAAGFSGIAGHRSLGGLRVSLYNGVSLASTQLLASFLRDFASRVSA